jgi:hypothetical protein
MKLHAIDQRIRTSMPDGPERRLLLTDVADLSEGINQMLGWLLAVQGYSYDVDSDTWSQARPPIRQVNL